MKIKMTEEERRLRKNTQKRVWKLRNPEKVRAWQRAYQLRNPEKVLANQRAYQLRNPEKVRAWQRAYQLRNPEKFLANQRAWLSRNLEKVRAQARARSLKRNFGITQARYIELLRGQGGGCAICGSTNSGRNNRNFCVDHDHKTGSIRGLLCFSCNHGLGQFKDSTVTLQAAICYLQPITSLLS